MFQFALDAVLFAFRYRAPHLEPLLQLPPRRQTAAGEAKEAPTERGHIPKIDFCLRIFLGGEPPQTPH